MEQLYTVKDVMDIFRVSRTTIHRLVASGKLKPIKIGDAVRFADSELQRYVDSLKDESA